MLPKEILRWVDAEIGCDRRGWNLLIHKQYKIYYMKLYNCDRGSDVIAKMVVKHFI